MERDLARRSDPPAVEGTISQDRTRLAFWVLVLLTAVSVALGVYMRISILGGGSLWLDELWTLDAVSRSFREMVGARLVSDQSPPLWTALTWVWLQVAGTYDTSTMRILPALFGTIAIVAPLIGAAKMRALRPTLLVMASIMALSLFALQYSVEMRPYSMMIALGTVATVIWAGLLTAQVPRTGLWIFLFALTGALAGFAHYYGNLLYVGESAVLLVLLARERLWRPVLLHVGWGAVSVIPVVAWYIFTRPWARNEAVAAPPSIAEIQTWSAYVVAPIPNVISGSPLGYPGVLTGLGLVLPGVAAVAIVGSLVADRVLGRASHGTQAVTLVLMCSAIVLVAGLGTAWLASVLMPPSMNTRNLAALLPVTLLAIAAACTLPRSDGLRWVTASGTVGVWLVAVVLLLAQYGVAVLAPPWQQGAAYRTVSQLLLASANDTDPPTLIGLDTPWDWHGQWDAAIRAETRADPAISTDPLGLPITWVGGVDGAAALQVPDGPLIVFSDSYDQRATDLFAWAMAERGPCELATYGGPGFGAVDLLRCG